MNYLETVKEQYGKWLRKARQRQNLSVRELARRIGLNHSYLSRIELGRVPPPFGHKLALIARELQSPKLMDIGEYALIEYLRELNGSLLIEYGKLSPALRRELGLDAEWSRRCIDLQYRLHGAYEKRTKRSRSKNQRLGA